MTDTSVLKCSCPKGTEILDPKDAQIITYNAVGHLPITVTVYIRDRDCYTKVSQMVQDQIDASTNVSETPSQPLAVDIETDLSSTT